MHFDSTDMESRFAVALYQWAIADCITQSEKDFPLLIGWENPIVQKFREQTAKIGKARSTSLCRALVKEFHPAAVRKLAVSFTLDETTELEQYRSIRAKDKTSAEEKVDGAELRRRLKKSITRVFKGGEKFFNKSNGVIEHDLGDMFWLRTDIDLGGSFSVLACRHRIYRRVKEREIVICASSSILNSYGISGETFWSPSIDYEATIASFEMTTQFFIAVLRSIVGGI